jgi:cation diffusion facilitator CzcD-associated flavoprotein CzcO
MVNHMDNKDYSRRYCIIGAGAAGLTAAKNLKEQGIPFDLIEREDDVGGNWYYGKPCSSIYKSVHTVSSREFTEYPDYPIPKDTPIYLRASDALTYLRNYAQKFGIYQHAQFGRSVLDLTPVEGSAEWDVTLNAGEVRRYQGVLVANGHLCKPRLPDYPGQFDGLQLHSAQYKTPNVLAGKRVLVVGAGNSGCDIAVEAVHHASAVFHSTRRGYYYWPKFVFGMPVDQWAEWALRMRMPVWARRFFGGLAMRMHSAGQPEDYNLPKPDHKLFESHFIVNSTLFYHLGHGDLISKGDVSQFCGDHVLFADGTQEQIDVIVYATGFELSFPFIDQKHLTWEKSYPKLDLNIFDRKHKNLFFIGLFQTATGNWPLMDYQSQLLSRYLNAQKTTPQIAARIEKDIQRESIDTSGGVRFSDTPRHSIEVEHFSYRRKLRRLTKALDAAGVSKNLPQTKLAYQA